MTETTAESQSFLAWLGESVVDNIVAENEELYHAQIEKLERDYGGRLVKDKALHQLLTMQAVRHETKTGKYPDTIRPPEFPAEEFIPISLTFTVEMFGLDLSVVLYKTGQRGENRMTIDLATMQEDIKILLGAWIKVVTMMALSAIFDDDIERAREVLRLISSDVGQKDIRAAIHTMDELCRECFAGGAG